MKLTFIVFLLLGFLAVVLLLEAGYHFWANRNSAEAKRIASRLSTLEGLDHAEISLERNQVRGRFAVLDRWLVDSRQGQRLQKHVVAAGMTSSAGDIMVVSAGFGVFGLLGALMLGRPLLFGAIVAVILAALPWLRVNRLRQQRVIRFDSQFPEALDLMSRALRAGHALPTAIKLCGEELAEPIKNEFRILSDEMNYGVPLHDALQNMARRVPVPDIGYFVVAVLIQRETGGNMAELLDNISVLVRDRLKLRGQVRTMSAEGRTSALVLTLLPFGMGLLMYLLNPKQMAPLWETQTGQNMVSVGLGMLGVGIVWMRSIVAIRV